MAEEEPQRKRKRSSGRSSQESLVNHCRSRSGSRSTLSSPGSSPRRLGPRKSASPTSNRQRRVSAEALEQGIAAIKTQYGHRRVSVAYVQGGDHSAAVLTLSRTTSPTLERARVHHQSRYSSSMRGSSASNKARRTSSVIEQTKSSMLGSPKTHSRHHRTSPLGRHHGNNHGNNGHNHGNNHGNNHGHKGSQSSPSLTDSRREHHRTSGHRSNPTSKTALLSAHSHWDKTKTNMAEDTAEDEEEDTEEDLSTHTRLHGRTGRRGLEMAVAGCIMLLGTGALMVAFMWGGDSAWTIVGSTCMSLGALFLVLGVCWYLSKTRDGEQDERLEIRVVDAKQMARLIKQGLRVKPVDAV